MRYKFYKQIFHQMYNRFLNIRHAETWASTYLRLKKINIKMKIIVTYPKTLRSDFSTYFFTLLTINWVDIKVEKQAFIKFQNPAT